MDKAFATRAVHAGRHDFIKMGVHAPPLDFSSTYPTPDLDVAARSFDSLVAGDAPEGTFVYQRLFNPTTDRFERALAELEGAEDAAAFASGMAAFSAVLLAAQKRGTNVVAVRPLYGTADHLLTSGMLGMTVTWATQDGIAAAIRPDTALVVIETPANPTLELMDIAEIVRQAGSVPVMVDSTFATPVLQRPLTLGAALVMHSATKFLGGHGDVLGPGSILALELGSDDPAVLRHFLGTLEIITPAVSLGSTDSLIQPPAALTHRVVEEQAREEVGVSRGLLRLSVGVEDVRDLWRDLDHALAEVSSRLEHREMAPVLAP